MRIVNLVNLFGNLFDGELGHFHRAAERFQSDGPVGTKDVVVQDASGDAVGTAAVQHQTVVADVVVDGIDLSDLFLQILGCDELLHHVRDDVARCDADVFYL